MRRRAGLGLLHKPLMIFAKPIHYDRREFRILDLVIQFLTFRYPFYTPDSVIGSICFIPNLPEVPALRCGVNCSFHVQWCWFKKYFPNSFRKYMVCRVCNLRHIPKPSSHDSGLENIWFVGYAIWDILRPSSHDAGVENIWFVGDEIWDIY